MFESLCNSLVAFFDASYQKMSATATNRWAAIVVAVALFYVLRSALYVISHSRETPMFLTISFILMAFIWLLDLLAILDYYNSKFGWLPNFKIRS